MGDQVPYSAVGVFNTLSILQSRQVSTSFENEMEEWPMFSQMIMVIWRIKHVKAVVPYSGLKGFFVVSAIHVVITLFHTAL